MSGRRLFLTTSVALVLCLCSAVPSWADFTGGMATVTRNPAYSGWCGEFTISGTSLSISGYASVATPALGANSFQSFCVDRFEAVAEKSNVTVSTTFINETTGAVTGPGSHAVYGRKTIGDNLEAETAFLYTMFATGKLGTMNLGGYNYDYTPGIGRQMSSLSLQAAIWAFEEGIPTSAGTQRNAAATAVADAWKKAAEDMVKNKAWTGIGGVRVLNMTTPTGGVAQDQLYYVPLPASILLGVFAVGLAGRKLRKFV